MVKRFWVGLVLLSFFGASFTVAGSTLAWAAPYDVTATIAVGTGPYGVAVSPDGTKAYVTNMTDGTVSVIDLRAPASASTSAGPGVPGIFLTVAGPVGRSASEAPLYYGADRVAVTSTYLLTVTGVSNIAPTVTTLAEGTIDANGSFSAMTRLPALGLLRGFRTVVSVDFLCC